MLTSPCSTVVEARARCAANSDCGACKLKLPRSCFRRFSKSSICSSALIGFAPPSRVGSMRRRARSPARSADIRADTCIAWQAETLGALSNLQRAEVAVPAVGDGEVRVGVRAIGLNYADVFCVLGLYEAANKFLKDSGEGALVPGLEFSGESRFPAITRARAARLVRASPRGGCSSSNEPGALRGA